MISEEEIRGIEKQAHAIRVTIVQMLSEAKSGHLAGPLGMAAIFQSKSALPCANSAHVFRDTPSGTCSRVLKPPRAHLEAVSRKRQAMPMPRGWMASHFAFFARPPMANTKKEIPGKP